MCAGFRRYLSRVDRFRFGIFRCGSGHAAVNCQLARFLPGDGTGMIRSGLGDLSSAGAEADLPRGRQRALRALQYGKCRFAKDSAESGVCALCTHALRKALTVTEYIQAPGRKLRRWSGAQHFPPKRPDSSIVSLVSAALEQCSNLCQVHVPLGRRSRNQLH